MYTTKFFKLAELVSKEIYNRYDEKAWEFFDPKALMTLDDLRKAFHEAFPGRFKGLVVNDWSWGGQLKYRGYREKTCPVGADNSQHRHGRAFDCSESSGMVRAEEMRQYILHNQTKFPYITCIEKDKGWLHFDVRNVDTPKGIILFNG